MIFEKIYPNCKYYNISKNNYFIVDFEKIKSKKSDQLHRGFLKCLLKLLSPGYLVAPQPGGGGARRPTPYKIQTTYGMVIKLITNNV